ncbi:type II secretion system protein J [Cellulosimicrobium cellulans]|uniref:PulJ/GspJ family protein n=1 Tax=Cellulosimicrobium cellulans TaxID=1710 RepID=UPI001652770A|nr:prepilin-type N-terminal cleavage/methylation domain-containing protein [Cellulosimicrobium cellulans]
MTARRRRVRRPRVPGADAGVTLTELIVAMAVFSIVLVGVAALTAGIQRSDRAAWDRVDDTEEGRYALMQLSRVIGRAVVPTTVGGRERAAFADLAPDAFTVYADLDNPGGRAGPSRVEYALVDGELTQTTRRPVEGARATYCADDDATPECEGRVQTVVLARAVRGGADPLFRYLDAEGDETDAPHRVRTVLVALAIQQDPTTGDEPSRFTDRLTPSGLLR